MKAAVRLAEAPDIMTIEQAAEFLGLSRSVTYEGVRTGQIPSLRVGRRYVIAKAALIERLGVNGGAAE